MALPPPRKKIPRSRPRLLLLAPAVGVASAPAHTTTIGDRAVGLRGGRMGHGPADAKSPTGCERRESSERVLERAPIGWTPQELIMMYLYTHEFDPKHTSTR